MIIPHNTILIAVVGAAFAPWDDRLLARSSAPAGTRQKHVCGWHGLVGTWVQMGIYWQTRLLTATLKGLLLPLRFKGMPGSRPLGDQDSVEAARVAGDPQVALHLDWVRSRSSHPSTSMWKLLTEHLLTMGPGRTLCMFQIPLKGRGGQSDTFTALQRRVDTGEVRATPQLCAWPPPHELEPLLGLPQASVTHDTSTLEL